MHPKEYKKQKNGTGFMTQLQLLNSEIIVGVDFSHNDRVNALLGAHPNAFLLYPGKDNFNLSSRKPQEIQTFLGTHPLIFILDGTWPCARKMLKLSRNLQSLPRVSFDPNIQSKFLIKQQPTSLCLSTIESVYTVLNTLNAGGVESCDTQNFLAPFEKMIALQLDFILDPTSPYNLKKAKIELKAQNNYKDPSERNVFYDPTEK